MFQFPGFASCKQDTLTGGFPHSEIRGSKIALISPRLIAECHVLHRLSTPRHPPNALLALVPFGKPSHAGENAVAAGKSRRNPGTVSHAPSQEIGSPHDAIATSPSIRLSPEILRGNSGRQDWRGQLYYLIYDVSEPGRPTNAGPIGIAKTYSLTNAVSRAPENPTPKLVEPIGFEPTTSCLQSRRSPD